MNKYHLFILLCIAFLSCKKRTATQPSADAKIVQDISYGDDNLQKIDLYLPGGRDSNTPVIILVHGGAWMAGDKTDMQVLVPLLQSAWPEAAIANVNYRLADGKTVTANQIMVDIRSALDFLSNHKDSLIFSTKYGLMGASAGAQLSLLYAYTQDADQNIKAVADLYGPCIIDDWSWYSSFNVFLGQSIKDVLTNYIGSTWEADSAAYHSNSPYTQLKASNGRPTIVFHGSLDVIVPIYQSQWLSAKLKSTGIVNEYYEYLDGHGFNAQNNQDCIKKTVAFFKKQIQ